jgi:hypothetical protein
MIKHRMLLLRPRYGEEKLRWRGTGFCTSPGGMTRIEHERRWSIKWYPIVDKMAWFFWNHRMGASRVWRIGPLNFQLVDRMWCG